MIWDSHKVHGWIEQINTNQVNITIEIFLPIKNSARPTKTFQFLQIACKLIKNEEIIVI